MVGTSLYLVLFLSQLHIFISPSILPVSTWRYRGVLIIIMFPDLPHFQFSSVLVSANWEKGVGLATRMLFTLPCCLVEVSTAALLVADVVRAVYGDVELMGRMLRSVTGKQQDRVRMCLLFLSNCERWCNAWCLLLLFLLFLFLLPLPPFPLSPLLSQIDSESMRQLRATQG